MSLNGKALWPSRSGGKVVAKPSDVSHLSAHIQSLASRISSLDGKSRIIMECAGRYYAPSYGSLRHLAFFRRYEPTPHIQLPGQGPPLRKVKSDKADSL